jgi:hypothetical protein
MSGSTTVLLDALDEPELLHVLNDALAGLEAIEPRVLARLRGHPPVEADDRARGQVVAPSDLEVDGIVARGDLDDARPELRIHGAVRDHAQGDGSLDRRHLQRLAHVLRVALVLGMHGHRGVAQLRLRAHRAQSQRAVLDVDEVRVALFALHLEIRQHGLAARAPVDDVVVLVDEAFLVETDEGLAHGAGQPGIHGEALARPVAGGAEALELADDGPAGFLLPLPGALQEDLPPDVVSGLALGGELPLQDHVDGDGGVVGAGDPQGVVAVHALVADENVLQRVVEGVPPVERAGDVGRGHDDGVGRLGRGGIGAEESALFPFAVPA